MSAHNKFLVVVAGPTAVGKTALAIELARHFGTEILSADSRQFYRELSIGTAKPSAEQLASAPHHFVDNKSITELYGAGHYARDAAQRMSQLFANQDLLIMVGGSGLYIDAVLNGVDDFAEVPAELRSTLNAELQHNGLEALQAELLEKDPVHFESIDRQNPQRIVRALEVIRHTGRPYSSFLDKQTAQRDFVPIKLLINTNRQRLYEQINQRTDAMMQQGLLAEAEAFSQLRHLNALKTVGYRELYDYMDGNGSLADAVTKIKQHTRNYAKRQLTWFRNRDQFMEFAPDDVEGIQQHIGEAVHQARRGSNTT